MQSNAFFRSKNTPNVFFCNSNPETIVPKSLLITLIILLIIINLLNYTLQKPHTKNNL